MGTNRRATDEVVRENIDRLRRDKGLSRRGLAIKAKVSPSGLSKTLRGLSSPTVETLDLLCNVLEVPPWLLLVPDLSCDVVRGEEIERLVGRYLESDEKHRKIAQSAVEP